MWCCYTTIIRKALFVVLIKIEETLVGNNQLSSKLSDRAN